MAHGSRFGLAVALSLSSPLFAEEVAKPPYDDARLTARTWLAGLRDQTPDKIVANTQFPLAVEGIGPTEGPAVKKCKSANAVKDAKAAAGLWKCLFADKSLLDSLPADLALAKWSAVEGEPPAVFERKKEKIVGWAKDHTLVQAVVVGDGVTHTLLFAVKKTTTGSAVEAVVAAAEKEEKHGVD